jgi:hypothetical protein
MPTKHELPWPKDHKGHWWSGWPGAYCLRCHAGDPIEEMLADNRYDPGWPAEGDAPAVPEFWAPGAKEEFEKRSICPADKIS